MFCAITCGIPPANEAGYNFQRIMLTAAHLFQLKMFNFAYRIIKRIPIMKSRVKLSTFSIILTAIITGALVAGCIVTYPEKPAFMVILAVLALIVMSSLLYAPLSIEADPDKITVRSAMKSRYILMRDVTEAKLFQPTMGAIRLFASGGYMGYWGIFREGDIGRYMAYYGKASDCFLIRLKNGDKYVLGCKDSSDIVSYIRSQMK